MAYYLQTTMSNFCMSLHANWLRYEQRARRGDIKINEMTRELLMYSRWPYQDGPQIRRNGNKQTLKYNETKQQQKKNCEKFFKSHLKNRKYGFVKNL